MINIEKIEEDYNISFSDENKEKLKKYGKESLICKALDYLINELHISPSNISKCPSVLYRNVESIKENYILLIIVTPIVIYYLQILRNYKKPMIMLISIMVYLS